MIDISPVGDRLIIDGKPVSAPRPRFSRFSGAYMPKAYQTVKMSIALRAKAKLRKPQEGPCRLSLTFWMGRPPTTWTKEKRQAAMESPNGHTSKPDIDNLVKTIMDALSGIAWQDDAQVVEVRAIKHWGVPARTEVFISWPKDGDG